MRLRLFLCLLFQSISGLVVTAQQATDASAPQATAPAYQVLSESTIQLKDGGSVTFQQVIPPAVTPPVQPAPAATAPVLTAAQIQEAGEMTGRETQMLSISASVHANGLTVLRWTSGTSQRLHAISNVDFRFLEGVANLQTAQKDYFIILSAGVDEQPMSAAEMQVAQSLPQDAGAVFALAGDITPAGAADESALDAMSALLDYYDAHKDELVALKAQRDADRAARDLAALNAPPPPPRRSVVQFWPLQPAQRAAILENSQKQKGAQPQ